MIHISDKHMCNLYIDYLSIDYALSAIFDIKSRYFQDLYPKIPAKNYILTISLQENTTFSPCPEHPDISKHTVPR